MLSGACDGAGIRIPSWPRRSILVLFVGGEEHNLLGSAYYAQHPTFPAGKIAGNVNYDGGNIFGRTRDVTLVSAGKSSIDRIAEGVAQRQGRVVKPDQFPDRGYYYRSDQFAFAKIGVPALYFEAGTDFVGRPAGWASRSWKSGKTSNITSPVTNWMRAGISMA